MPRASLLVLLAPSLLLACGEPGPLCVPGETQECVGPGACRGGQMCNAEGSGFEACVCATEEGDAGVVDAGIDAGADAGASMDAALDGGITDAGIVDAELLDASGDGATDAEADAAVDASATTCGPPGLYLAGSCSVLAPGVRPFEPAHALWTDGASKERFIFLPPGELIDTTDPDNWVFPVGTRIYKTFSLGGVRLETRLLEKTGIGVGPAVWNMIPYAWNAAQDAVTDVGQLSFAERENVLGTDHDIPSSSDCVRCHSGSLDVVNGFSAIQINHELGGVTLQTMLDESLLTDPIAPADADIPGDATTVAALGYLHANCGHCHRFTQFSTSGDFCSPDGSQNCGTCSPANTQPCSSGFLSWVRVGDASPEETDTYVTGVGFPSGNGGADPNVICRVHPGAPDTSRVIERMSRRDFDQMPPTGTTEFVDATGVAIVRTWISGVVGNTANCVP